MTALEFNHQVISQEGNLLLQTRRFTQDVEYAKDLVQDTMLKALTNRDKFREHTNLKGWLYTIMRNIFINTYRKSQTLQKVGGDSGDYFISSEIETHTFNKPDKVAEYNELISKLNELPQSQKTPFDLHFKGYKYHEIADKLSIPIGTVKNRIFQARKSLQSITQLTRMSA